MTRSGPRRRPAARSRRAKCITFSASLARRQAGRSRLLGALQRRIRAPASRRPARRRSRGSVKYRSWLRSTLGEPVDVVHHQAGGARHAVRRGVGQPVEALQRGAVAEVEARHRVERLVALLGVQQVPARTGASAASAAPRGDLAGVPAGLLERASSARRAPPSAADSCRASRRASQRAESRDRRQRGEASAGAGTRACRSSATCLISRLPKEMPRRPSWQLVIE